MRIIAYTYEADYHCIDCTKEKYHYSTQSWIDWNFKSTHPACDINGIHVNQLDNEGNLVHPVFSTDEWYDISKPSVFEDGTCDHYYDWQCVCNDDQHMVCGDCHDIIETIEREPMGVANE